MTNDAGRPTAQIYQFPIGGRRALGPSNAAGVAAFSAHTEDAVEIAQTSGWYHGDAVREDTARKH